MWRGVSKLVRASSILTNFLGFGPSSRGSLCVLGFGSTFKPFQSRDLPHKYQKSVAVHYRAFTPMKCTFLLITPRSFSTSSPCFHGTTRSTCSTSLLCHWRMIDTCSHCLTSKPIALIGTYLQS